MEDDTEVLDWGHEEEDGVAARDTERRTFSVDDAEDAVSLGGDEEDEFLTDQSRVPQDTVHHADSPPKSSRQPKQDPSKGRSDSPHPRQEQPTESSGSAADQSSLPGRAHTFGALVHALPPKPVVSSVPFVHPSHPSIIEATAMASRADRDKRNGAGSKATVYDHNDSLPPDWEVKYPRNGRGVYYYNILTRESTWDRPTLPTTREKRSERSDRRDDPLDKSLSTRNNENVIPRVGRAESGDMSYNDRHYRPAETGRRQERPTPSTQLVDSYVPESYSPQHRNNRTSPPPPRTRERDSTPPPRRPVSPNSSYGDRDGMHSSYREASSAAAFSAQDRIWVPRDVAARERPKEPRQHDDSTPETERRNLPRDTERSSTLRPRSPASYTRGSRESANTTLHSSIKPSQPVLEAPLGKRNRFSQADNPVQHAHRQSESRDVGMRRIRTDDVVSHSARHVDDVPSSHSMSDVRGDDDTTTHPTSDAQRPGSRKRTPLPPQDEIFRPGTRLAPAQRGGSYPSGPAASAPVSVIENRHTSRIVPDDTPRDSVRASPSPPPQPAPQPAERGDRERGRSRWSKMHVNGPLEMSSHATCEPSRGRAHDVTMDVDDVPLPRSSDLPAKQIPPRRQALQDEVPRYPRAMLNSDNDGLSRGVREARDGIDSRHRSTVDDSSRFGPSRDRLGMERADQTTPQKDPIRGVEIRPPPSGSNIKLSGTNNIPIGARNKFASNVPSPVPPSSTRRVPIVISASHGDPGVPRRDRVNKDQDRPSHLDGTAGDRSVPTDLGGREEPRRSPLNNPRALPPVESTPVPTRPSRAALGISRFGPPIIKENIEPARQQISVSEALPSSQVPEDSSHPTPPPLSRESSMASFKDVVAPLGHLTQLPLRPPSPPRGHRFRSGDFNKPLHRFNVQNTVAHESRGDEVNAEASASPKPSSPAPQKRKLETYPSEPPPAPRDAWDAHSPERARTSFRDSEIDRPPPPPIIRGGDRNRAPPPMHPERALMLQVNGLPPRPPSVLGRVSSTRGAKRERYDDHDYERAEPLRGNSGGHYHSVSPGSERRYPEDDRPVGHGGGGGGASLLDRLSLDDGSVNTTSLRDRVQLPSKREREEMLSVDFALDVEGDDYDGLRKVRRRGGNKMRKGRH